MNLANMKLIIVFAVILLAVIAVFVLLKIFWGDILSKTVKISGPVEIGPNWLEIRPYPQLKAEKNVQHVSIGVSQPIGNISEWNFKDGAFITPTGDRIIIEVQLINTQGVTYNLDSLSIGPGLGFSRTGETSSNGSYSSLPQNEEYSVVKIRSDKPLKIDWVKWVVSSSK